MPAAGHGMSSASVRGVSPNRRNSQMQSDSGRTTSVWMAGTEMPHYPPLSGDAACDVCIVGAGIAGMTAAYLLAREGREVIVLDDGPIGGGETGRTTAHLSNALDDRYSKIE